MPGLNIFSMETQLQTLFESVSLSKNICHLVKRQKWSFCVKCQLCRHSHSLFIFNIIFHIGVSVIDSIRTKCPHSSQKLNIYAVFFSLFFCLVLFNGAQTERRVCMDPWKSGSVWQSEGPPKVKEEPLSCTPNTGTNMHYLQMPTQRPIAYAAQTNNNTMVRCDEQADNHTKTTQSHLSVRCSLVGMAAFWVESKWLTVAAD